MNGITSNSLSLKWDALIGASGYYIEYGRSFDYWLPADTVNTNNYVLTGLLSGTSYTWRVYALFPDDDFSAPVSAGYTSTSGFVIAKRNVLQNEIPNDHKAFDFSQPMDTTIQRNTEMQNETLQSNSIPDKRITVSPNPFKNEIEISLYSVNGKQVKTNHYATKSREYEMDGEGLAPGIYILHIICDGKTIGNIKLVKE